MSSTAILVERLIAKYMNDGTLSEHKEDLISKLDIFLLVDRITGQEYKDLKQEIETALVEV